MIRTTSRTRRRDLKKAREQALRYTRTLPSFDDCPPFLVVADVGFVLTSIQVRYRNLFEIIQQQS